MVRYPRLDLPLPLELVNTSFASGGRPVDGLATLTDLDAWLHANAALFALDHLEVSEISRTPALLERLRQLRAAVRHLLTAVVDATTPFAPDVRLLNELAAGAPRFPHLDVDDHGTYSQRVVDRAETTEAAALGSLARAAMDLLGGADVARLRRCAGPGCVLFFLRERRRREWCSDACGNRARVARHYEQHRRSAGPS